MLIVLSQYSKVRLSDCLVRTLTLEGIDFKFDMR